MKISIFLLLFVLMFFGATGVGVAASTSPTTERVSRAQARAFERAKLSVREALGQAERRGTVIDIAFAVEHGRPVYHVKTYQNSTVWEGTLDASTGTLLGSGKSTPESQREDQAELAGLKDAKVKLDAAIESAERQIRGRAITAGLEERDGQIIYELKIVNPASVLPVTISPGTGELKLGAPEPYKR
jgi:uncharacterized membrane protein YkoI